MSRKIESTNNPIFKLANKLLAGRGISKEERFLLPSSKLIQELLDSPNSNLIETILVNEKADQNLFSKNKSSFLLTEPIFKQLDSIGVGDALAICKLPAIEDANLQEILGMEVALSLSDPGNLGAAIRTCLAFEVQKIILCAECANPFLVKVVKASAGSVLHAPLFYGPHLKELPVLENSFSLDMNGLDINTFSKPKNLRLIVGQEGLGIPEELSDIKKISIRINPQVESLNAMVSLGIALHSFKK